MFLRLVIVSALVACAVAEINLEECFKKDSISCLQLQVYRKAREFFSQEKIDLLGGISLTQNANDRAGKSSENVLLDQQVEGASDVESRESAIESYLWSKMKSFVTERSISWNVGQTARSLVNAIPEEVRNDVSDLVEEGRGKKKKALKKLMPLFMLFKLKLVGLLGLAYIITALIAKKAILASLVSLAISGYIALKKLISKSHDHHEDWHSAPSSGGWAGSYGGHDDIQSAYSSPIAQHLAYNGQIKH